MKDTGDMDLHATIAPSTADAVAMSAKKSVEKLAMIKGSDGQPSEGKPRLAKSSRCFQCRRKMGLATTFECRCGKHLCRSHRHPEDHACLFDWRAVGKAIISSENPKIVACKVAPV